MTEKVVTVVLALAIAVVFAISIYAAHPAKAACPTQHGVVEHGIAVGPTGPACQ